MPSRSKTQKVIVSIAVCLLMSLVAVKVFFIDYFRIPQNGMYPGLPAGSIVVTWRRAYSRAADVKRGDIVIFVREEQGQRFNYIWRVIALPGEKVEASGESLKIDGELVQRSRVREADGRTVFHEQIGDASYEIAFTASPGDPPPDVAVVVPADEFFVMGDNRNDARDSRYFGPISFRSIIGRTLKR